MSFYRDTYFIVKNLKNRQRKSVFLYICNMEIFLFHDLINIIVWRFFTSF